MKHTTKHLLVLAAAAAMIGFGTHTASAQGNFDPAQARQRQMENYRDRLEVKAEEDWKKLEPLITKVLDAQRDARSGMGFGGFGGGRPGGRGGAGGAGGGDQANNAGGNRNRFGGQPNPDVEALQKAIDDKAPADEIKAKLAKLRESRKTKDAAVEKAQDELSKALTPRQQASAVLAGLLK